MPNIKQSSSRYAILFACIILLLWLGIRFCGTRDIQVNEGDNSEITTETLQN